MPTLEERQVYKSGKSSFAITLPRGWGNYLRLKPGDKAEVEANGQLVIRPIKRQEDAETETGQTKD